MWAPTPKCLIGNRLNIKQLSRERGGHKAGLVAIFKPDYYNMHAMKSLKYNVVFYPEPEGGFTAVVPSLPGCVTYGQDLNEARRLALDAISGYITSLKKHKEPIPSDDQSFISLVDFSPSVAV